MSTHVFSFKTPDSIRPNPLNTRTHSHKQIQKLKKSIQAVGFSAPVVVNEQSELLCGHARLEAARQLQLPSVPVIMIYGLTPAKQRALMLADNRIAQDAGTDWQKLAIELPDLKSLLALEGLDIDITGYDVPEIEAIATNFEDKAANPADDFESPTGATVTRSGDMWVADSFRLLCGDARVVSDVARLMNGAYAQMAFLDVPFNLKVSSIVGRGATKYREFSHASGEMTPEQFTTFLKEAAAAAADVSADGAIHYICMDWRHLAELMTAGKAVYGTMLNLVAWVKENAGQGSFYRSQHEMIGVFRVGNAPHLNNIELGRHGRNRSNVWRYAGVNSFRVGRMDDLAVHPTVKPVAMIVEAIKDCTKRGDIVLDTFSGSGSTLLAAERVGRRGYGIEIDPQYVDVAVRRWQEYTGLDVRLADSGRTFGEIAAERGVVVQPKSTVPSKPKVRR